MFVTYTCYKISFTKNFITYFYQISLFVISYRNKNNSIVH